MSHVRYEDHAGAEDGTNNAAVLADMLQIDAAIRHDEQIIHEVPDAVWLPPPERGTAEWAEQQIAASTHQTLAAVTMFLAEEREHHTRALAALQRQIDAMPRMEPHAHTTPPGLPTGYEGVSQAAQELACHVAEQAVSDHALLAVYRQFEQHLHAVLAAHEYATRPATIAQIVGLRTSWASIRAWLVEASTHDLKTATRRDALQLDSRVTRLLNQAETLFAR